MGSFCSISTREFRCYSIEQNFLRAEKNVDNSWAAFATACGQVWQRKARRERRAAKGVPMQKFKTYQLAVEFYQRAAKRFIDDESIFSGGIRAKCYFLHEFGLANLIAQAMVVVGSIPHGN
jgi:hypothetical protein